MAISPKREEAAHCERRKIERQGDSESSAQRVRTIRRKERLSVSREGLAQLADGLEDGAPRIWHGQ